MHKTVFIIGVWLLLLSSCLQPSSQTEPINTQETQGSSGAVMYLNTEIGYQLSLARPLTDSGSWMNSSTNEHGPFFGTPVDHSVNPPFGVRQVSIEIHHVLTKKETSNEQPTNQGSCSDITGASQTREMVGTNGKTVWGRVDYWDRFDSDMGGHGIGGGIDERVVCTNYGIPIYPAIYGLCSEKNGKTVVICINQMTDNEPLAKQIFETFRWLP